MASNKTEKIFQVAVVGMSGTTDIRGDFGVGKSCLCNRFMTAHEDEYHYRHNSIIRQCDFSGGVVNNDHFLYWGNVLKRFDGTDFHFRIIEQTEFIDDMSFTTLNGANSKPYFRRCAETKLYSRGKRAYICHDQLSDEQDFPKATLPRGKFQVEGYLLVFDVSNVKGRSITRQKEFVQKLYSAICNTRRPIVLVATKCDIAEDMAISEIKQFAKEKRLSVVECSAQKGVNVDLPFRTLASLIDRSRGRPRNITYKEGLKRREQEVGLAEKKYIQLLDAKVTDYHSVWISTKVDLEKKENYQEYVKLVGTRLAKKHFWNHTKKLKEIHQNKKLEQYLSKMQEMLVDTYPDLVTINERYWPACRDALPKHPRFKEWFVDFNEPWEDSKYIDTDDVKIPFQLITDPKYSAKVESYFQEHVQRLLETKKKERYKSEFRTMLGILSDTILPGSNFHEMRLYLEPFECYQMLDEQERMAVFITHQNEILQQAKEDLLELLIESTDLFKKLDKSGNVVEEVHKLQDQLSSDQRFKRLEKLPLERYGMIVKQFAFTHNLATNSCLHSKEKCIENQIRTFVRENPQMCDALTLNILLVGIDELTDDLAEEIKEMSKEGFQLNGVSVNIATEILDQKALTTNIREREDFNFDGCVCVFTSLQSFEYIKTTLEVTKIREEEDVPKVLSNIPVTLMFGRDPSIPESDLALRDEVQELVDRIPDSAIVDYPEVSVYPDKKFSPVQITSCMQTFRPMSTFRVAVVMMCGDTFNSETTLAYLMENHTCHRTTNCEFCVTMEILVDNKKEKMEVEIVSYHRAQLNCETIHHAYILCYSPRRKASLETMKSFTSQTSGIPTLIVAISDDSPLNSDLLQEGQNFADQSDNMDFMKGLPDFMQHNIMLEEGQFLIQAFRKKNETEKIHDDLFFKEDNTPSSESRLVSSFSGEEELSDSTPHNELASLGDISSMEGPSATEEGEDIMKKKLRKKRRSIKKKPVKRQKAEEFMRSLEQLVGQTTAEIGKSPIKHPIGDEPTNRKWWFKTRKPKGFLKGLSIEELPFRSENEVPLFVEKCVATIEDEGLTTEGIYRKPGRVAVIEDVITKIDKDPSFDITQLSNNIHAVASSFKQYFHALSEPFISYKTQTDLIKKFNDWPKDEFLIHLKSCVDSLSGRKYCLLKYVLLHLKRIIDHSDENKMHTDNVSICWWPCLLHPQSKSVKDLANEAKLASIFTLLLENVEMILGLEVVTEEEGMDKENNGQGEKMVEEEQHNATPNEP